MANTALASTEALEAHTLSAPPAPNTGASHLDDIEIIDILRWDAQGLTQQQIAAKFNPPKSQSTICRCLQKYGTDTRAEAKRIFAAGSAVAALKILKEGRPRDLLEVQRGINVLEEEQRNSLTVVVEGQAIVNFGPVSLGESRHTERRSAELPVITAGSDKPSYVNQLSHSNHNTLAEQPDYRKGREAQGA